MQPNFADIEIKSQHLPSVVADTLQEMIVNHQFHVGDRLPAERELASRLNVSRNVIREAIKLLQERGLVSVRSGSGVYINDFDTSVLSRSITLYVKRLEITIAQLYEMRWILEIQIARLAALRATPNDIAALHDCLERSAKHIDEPKAFTPLDVEFHRLLAQATQNPVILTTLNSIRDALEEQCHITEQLPGAQANAFNFHKRIFRKVQDGDASAAVEAMSDHLHSSWAWLMQALLNPKVEIGQMTFPEE